MTNIIIGKTPDVEMGFQLSLENKDIPQKKIIIIKPKDSSQ